MPNLAVIIVSYMKSDMVVECIDSVYRYNDIGDSLEVILVDNSPNSEVLNKVLEKFEKVTLVANENKGFGAGNNVGIDKTNAQLVLFLNPDTLLVEPVFKFAINTFQNNKALGMFGVQLISKEGKKNMSFFLNDGGGLIRSILIKICNELGFFIDSMMYVSGANIFVKRKVFIDAGMFDENIFMYYEEPDLAKRIHALGKKNSFIKTKRIIHLEGGATPEGEGENALRWRLESGKYLYDKHGGNYINRLTREIRVLKIKEVIRLFLVQKNESEKLGKNIKIITEFRNACLDN